MQKDQHIIDIIFILSLFCVFAVLALFVVVLGANVYKGISNVMTENYAVRTSLSYITEKIRQGDAHGEITVEQLGGGDALVITQDITNEGTLQTAEYETWIYVDNGNLMELVVNAGDEVQPGGGQPIMELKELRVEDMDGRLFKMTAVDAEGGTYESMVSLKGSPTGVVGQ